MVTSVAGNVIRQCQRTCPVEASMNKQFFFWDRFNDGHDFLIGCLKLSENVIQATPLILLVDLLIERIYPFLRQTYRRCVRSATLHTRAIPIEEKPFPSDQVRENIFDRPCSRNPRLDQFFGTQDGQMFLQSSPFIVNVFQELIFAGLFRHVETCDSRTKIVSHCRTPRQTGTSNILAREVAPCFTTRGIDLFGRRSRSQVGAETKERLDLYRPHFPQVLFDVRSKPCDQLMPFL